MVWIIKNQSYFIVAHVTTPSHMYMAFYIWHVYTTARNKLIMFYGCPHITTPSNTYMAFSLSFFYLACIYNTKVTNPPGLLATAATVLCGWSVLTEKLEGFSSGHSTEKVINKRKNKKWFELEFIFRLLRLDSLSI